MPFLHQFKGSWVEYKDGTEEGELRIRADYPDRLDELRKFVQETVRREKLWISAGATFTGKLDPEHYKKLRGVTIVLTHPRRGRDVGAVFIGAEEIVGNMMVRGYDPQEFVCRVAYGERPSYWTDIEDE